MASFAIQTPRGERIIGSTHPCFIVAEMSANHQQNYEKAVEIIKAAAAAGADAIKLQTYTPDTMTVDSRKEWFLVGGKENPEAWQGKTFYDLYRTAYTPWEWHSKLQSLAESLGLVFFSTPFDATAVVFLESLHVPLYKISSYEATDIPLLKRVAATKKPIVMSVGFATLPEIVFSVKTLRENGCKELALLHCVTSYSDKPAPERTNLRAMLALSEEFEAVAGFSDNNAGIEIPALAAAMGASIIEKHLVLENDTTALDARFSLDGKEFKKMVDKVRAQEKMMGTVFFGPQTPAEEYNRRFRRSLFVVKDVKAGETLTPDNIRSIRPATGLETRYYEEILGKVVRQDIEKGTPLTRDLIV